MKKRNLALIISAASLMVFAIVMLILAFSLKGYDILAWCLTPYGWTLWIAIFLYAIVAGSILLKDKVSRL